MWCAEPGAERFEVVYMCGACHQMAVAGYSRWYFEPWTFVNGGLDDREEEDLP
jgi:hypothetical protein